MIACLCMGIGELAIALIVLACGGSVWMTSVINRIRYARHCRCHCHTEDKHALCDSKTSAS